MRFPTFTERLFLLAFTLLGLLGCTETTEITVPPPPGADEILGTYQAAWVGGTGTLTGLGHLTPEALSFAAYPCATTESLGGGYEYDPNTGELFAEMKTIGGDVRIEVRGSFTSTAGAPRFSGRFQVLLLGAPCQEGVLSMERQ